MRKGAPYLSERRSTLEDVNLDTLFTMRGQKKRRAHPSAKSRIHRKTCSVSFLRWWSPTGKCLSSAQPRCCPRFPCPYPPALPCPQHKRIVTVGEDNCHWLNHALGIWGRETHQGFGSPFRRAWIKPVTPIASWVDGTLEKTFLPRRLDATHGLCAWWRDRRRFGRRYHWR